MNATIKTQLVNRKIAEVYSTVFSRGRVYIDMVGQIWGEISSTPNFGDWSTRKKFKTVESAVFWIEENRCS